MPLVTPLAKGSSPEVDQLALFFDETLGFTPNSVLTMQRRPEIASAFINLNKAVMANRGRVTSEQKRLIDYLASMTSGCRYCEAHTALAAERYGATKERLDAIWDYSVVALFGFLNRWNDSMGTMLEEGAAEMGNRQLSQRGWSRGKHV